MSGKVVKCMIAHFVNTHTIVSVGTLVTLVLAGPLFSSIRNSIVKNGCGLYNVHARSFSDLVEKQLAAQFDWLIPHFADEMELTKSELLICPIFLTSLSLSYSHLKGPDYT